MQVLDSRPEDCSVEDIQYELYVRHAIQKGEDSAERGKVVPHEEVMREIAAGLKR